MLPALIVIVATLAAMALVPIIIRELFYPHRRTRELDKWAEDLRDG
jgi:hypothetical protein